MDNECLKALVDMGISEPDATVIVLSMAGLSPDEKMQIVNHVKQEKENRSPDGNLWVALRQHDFSLYQTALIMDAARTGGYLPDSLFSREELFLIGELVGRYYAELRENG